MPTYFTPETFKFFRELKENNNKEWFDEHKPIYDQHIYQPIKDLVSLLSPVMHTIDADFELRPYKAVSRIYRDIRFSKDKTPYKTCMWFTFQKPISREEWTSIPGYFMEITGEDYTLGMGLYMPKKKTMDNFREEVSYIPQEFKEHAEEDVIKRGFSVCGEEYKRPVANTLDEYFQTWVQRKSVYVAKTVALDEKEVCSPDFYKKIEADFVALEWLYKFMKEVSEL